MKNKTRMSISLSVLILTTSRKNGIKITKRKRDTSATSQKTDTLMGKKQKQRKLMHEKFPSHSHIDAFSHPSINGGLCFTFPCHAENQKKKNQK